MSIAIGTWIPSLSHLMTRQIIWSLQCPHWHWGFLLTNILLLFYHCLFSCMVAAPLLVKKSKISHFSRNIWWNGSILYILQTNTLAKGMCSSSLCCEFMNLLKYQREKAGFWDAWVTIHCLSIKAEPFLATKDPNEMVVMEWASFGSLGISDSCKVLFLVSDKSH